MAKEHIRASKLSIPIHPDLFVSPRLSGILDGLTEKRLAVVTAGAGHGKTALTAWALRQKAVTPVWYHLDEQDRDFSRFIRYTAAGLKPCIPNPCPMMERLIAGAPFSAVHRGRALAALIHALEAAPGTRACLVFDDFHTVQDEKAILESVNFLVENLPPWFHIILLTRTTPEIGLSRLHLAGRAVEITESGLLFTLDETRRFLTTHLQPPLPLKLADQVHRISQGWVAGLVLFYLALKDLSPEGIGELPPGLAGSNKLMFNYFEQTIFRALAPETREFMLKTSLLDTLEPEFCDALLHITVSERILNQLVNGHFLTYRKESGQDNDRVYIYHHLLRSFLRTRIKQAFPRETITGLYLDIAKCREAAGNDLRAVRSYISGGFFDTAARLLMKHEKKLFESGQLLGIQGFLNGFPKQFIRSNPSLLYIQAKLESFLGNPHLSVSLYEIILDKPASRTSGAFLLDCRIQLGLNYYYTGHIPEAENLLETCLACKDPGKRQEIAGLLILIYVILGKIRRADALARSTQKELCRLPDSLRLKMKNWVRFILCYRDFVAGDFKAAYAGACQSLDWYSKTDADIIMPLSYLHGALPAYFLNKFDTGLGWAEKGLDLIREMGIRDNQAGWLNYAAALHLCGLERLDQALDRARKAMDRFTHQANYWGRAHVHDLIHFIRLKQGDLRGAENALEQGLTLLHRTGLHMTRGILETGMLGVWLETGRFDAVLEKAGQVLEKVGASGFYTFKTLMITARCRVHLNDRATALSELGQAVDIAAKYGYVRQVADAGPQMEPLLSALYAKGVRQGFIRDVFQRLNRVHCLPEQGIKEPVPPLQISLLGRFRMVLGEQNLRPETFNNTPGLTMIKYLALHRDKGFKHRDELIELLWPEQDFNKTRKRFNVVVSAVRKFFEPRIRRGAPSRYLKKQGRSFRLSLGHGGTVDVQAFRHAVQKGNRAFDMDGALPHYEAALAAYKGPFLAEDAYTQWCIEKRQILQDTYLSVLWKLVCHFLDRSQPDKGIYFAQKYLETDNSVEAVYQKLMQLYAAAGNRSLVKRTYEACRKNVFDALDCPADPETVRLFHEGLTTKERR